MCVQGIKSDIYASTQREPSQIASNDPCHYNDMDYFTDFTDDGLFQQRWIISPSQIASNDPCHYNDIDYLD